jgi:SAM-dependent methyltransferase
LVRSAVRRSSASSRYPASGYSTLELGELVGASGSVVGLDVSEPLLARARERALGAKYRNIEFVLGNAATTKLELPFDLLFSRFGEVNEWASVPFAAVRALRPGHPPPALLAPDKPGPFFFSQPSFVTSVLESAGFEDVAIEPYTLDLRIGGSKTLAEAIDYTLQIGPSSRFVADAELGTDRRLRPALEAALAPFVSERGVVVTNRTWIVTASVAA